jgi:hypothetical protein
MEAIAKFLQLFESDQEGKYGLRGHRPWAHACRAAPAARVTRRASHKPRALRPGRGRPLGSRRTWPPRDDEDSGEREGQCLCKKHNIDWGGGVGKETHL